MTHPKLNSTDFLNQLKYSTVIDVRTPNEFAQGHVPGAQNLPLFSNQQRHEIGLTYKRQGSQAAIYLGLKMVGPKLTDYIDQAREMAANQPILLYCWRGGMRSNSMAVLLQTADFQVAVLRGGYKTYRNFALKTFETPFALINLGGYTGSGKTALLHALRKKGEQVIDLEGLANHFGSAFGNLYHRQQPTSEQFENNLAWDLHQLNPNKPIYIEDESVHIGSVQIPHKFYECLQRAPMLFLTLNREKRTQNILQQYGDAPIGDAKAAVLRLKKRLGNEKAQKVLDAITKNNKEVAIDLLLDYYDKAYYQKLDKRLFSRLRKVNLDEISTDAASQIIKLTDSFYDR